MHFKNKKQILNLAFIAALSVQTGCGMLGEKDPAITQTPPQEKGCLNDATDLFGRYSRGEISEAEWKSSFDCVNTSLDFFTDFVRGTTKSSYTVSDMYIFASKFVMNNKPLDRNLMQSMFQLKRALIGGNSGEFTKEEIQSFKNLLPKFRDITADLLPYLSQQKRNNDYQTYFEMADAFERAGEQAADVMNSLPVGTLSEKALDDLIISLTKTLDIEIMDGLAQKAFIAKWLFFNSRPDAMEPQDWSRLIKTGFGLGGLFYAASLAPKGDAMKDYQYREFIAGVATRAKKYFDAAVDAHGGVIPLPLFDELIDQVPAEYLPANAQILKQSLRPIVRKFLQSDSKIGVDHAVINTVYKLANTWVEDMGLLDRFYTQLGLNEEGVAPSLFAEYANQYLSSLSDPAQRARFEILKNRMLEFKPLYYRNEPKIMFAPGVDYSKIQHVVVLSLYPFIEHLHQVYGSGNGFFIENDFQLVYAQFTDLLYALKMIDPTVSNFAGKRFLDLDLFTPASDGNGQADFKEITYFALMAISAGEMTAKMREEITPKCDQNLGIDILGWKWLSIPCFREEFHNKLPYWLTYFPYTKEFFTNLDEETRQKVLIWIEHGARRNGFSEENVGHYDFKSFPTVLTYAESLFTRFDQNGNQKLDRAEIFNGFPVFKILLAKKANMPASKNTMLQGIFTYIVKHKQMPDTASASGIAKLVWWLSIFKLPTTKISTDRAGVFNIICILGLPESPAQQELTKTICRP